MIEAEFFRRLAAAAAAQTLPRFRAQGLVTNKEDGGFDPVTEADQEAEQAIRSLIREEFADHGILGEEFGLERAESRHRWVIDPIDGTRAFISGLPLWGTLVGLTEDGDAVAGMMSQPFTAELFWASDGAAHYEGPGGARSLASRRTTSLAEATMCTTTPALFRGAMRDLYDGLERSVRLARYGTDCYAYAMLAAGQVDLVVETGLQPYDIVALVPIIEAAGGVITTWDGGPAEQAGDIVAAATPDLHAAALKMLDRL
jgi:histidinol phosphatase-like enzyme (inositol monophosphatase family)